MPEQTFQTSAHAKCILAGEHAVLRGCPAIVTPIPDKLITLNYKKVDQPVEVECDPSSNHTFRKFVLDILHEGFKLLNIENSKIFGKFYCENNILMGAGIGFSSALCVVISRWFIWQQLIAENQLFEFARHLEDSIHGKSSGLDVAGAMSNHITHFELPGTFYEITAKWQPKLFVSYSGFRKDTAKAIQHVNAYHKNNPQAHKILEEMKQSVAIIEQSISLDANQGLSLLAQGINQANRCFKEWNLITPELQKYIDNIQSLGAIATKPTGAGLGGYVLSLWENHPPSTQEIEFLPIRL